jgi:hypothetical protein
MILPREAQPNGGGGPLSGGGGGPALHCETFYISPDFAPSTTLRVVPLPRCAVEDQEQRP